MARVGTWAVMTLAVPLTVAFAPVHGPEAARWEPQVATANAASAAEAGLPVSAGPARAVQPVVTAGAVQRGTSADADSRPTAGRRAGSTAVWAALTRLGAPYVWAAAGPDAFDCSGLVVWAFEQAGVTLPHSSQSLAAGGQPVSPNQMRPGDVITYYSDASHVGIYVGGGKIVHASTYGVPVAVVPVDNAPIHNVRRYM